MCNCTSRIARMRIFCCNCHQSINGICLWLMANSEYTTVRVVENKVQPFTATINIQLLNLTINLTFKIIFSVPSLQKHVRITPNCTAQLNSTIFQITQKQPFPQIHPFDPNMHSPDLYYLKPFDIFSNSL